MKKKQTTNAILAHALNLYLKLKNAKMILEETWCLKQMKSLAAILTIQQRCFTEL